MKIRTGTKEFDAQYPIGAGVHVIAANEREDIKLLIGACGLAIAFTKALAEFALRCLESDENSTETAILLFKFQVRNFSGLAPVSITLSKSDDDGRAVFILFEDNEAERARMFAEGLIKQMAVEAARKCRF